MASTNSINNIEDWVKEHSKKMPKTGKLEPYQYPPSSLPPPIQDWKIYATSGSSNDCMIHSLLIDCSPTFRILLDEDKNTLAREFRTGPFLQIVLKFYADDPSKIVTRGGVSDRPLVEPERTLFLTDLIRSTAFLREEFLEPISQRYNINILLRSLKPGSLPFGLVPLEPVPANPTIVMYNPSSVHFSAMSSNGNIFILNTFEVVALKERMDDTTFTASNRICEYKEGEKFTVNRNDFMVEKPDSFQDTPIADGTIVAKCISVNIQNITPGAANAGKLIEGVPTSFFYRNGTGELSFNNKEYEEYRIAYNARNPGIAQLQPLIAVPVSSSSSSNPFAPSSSKSRTPTPVPPSGKTRAIPELFTPPAPPKPCPAGTAKGTGTGFTETLECVTTSPPVSGSTSFWDNKIIELIDSLKAKRHNALMRGDSANPIFDTYPEFKTLELDNTGNVIVPIIDKDRVQDYTSNEAEFNQVMKALQQRVEEIKILKPAFDAQFLPDNNQLNILTSMLEYPQNSQLENYFLITDFVDTRQIANTLLMGRTLNPPLKNIINFVALLVLFSRYGLEDSIIKKVTSMVTTNKWKELYSNLFEEFSNTDDTNFADLSTRLLGVFTVFLNKNQNIITDSFVEKLRDGTYMYEIYKKGYEKSDLSQDTRKSQFALSRPIIQQRTKNWIDIPEIDVRTIPTSFIFDRYTEEEKKFMIQENAICAEISELTGKLGKVNVPQMQIPHDFFIKESKENDKLAKFLEETGPNVSKDILAERRRVYFEGRGPFVGLSGGKGRKTKRTKHFRIRKKTRNNRKTRSKKH